MSDCPLCNVKESDVIWRDGSFFGLICRTCHVPLIVLTEHKEKITDEEMKEAEDIRKRRYPDYKFRGIGTRSIKSHWHEHIIK